MIRDAKQLREVVNAACPEAMVPDINFSKRTVLALFSSAGGCEITFDRAVVRDDASKTVLLQVTVRTKGSCTMEGSSMNWVSVPRIPADYRIAGTVSMAR